MTTKEEQSIQLIQNWYKKYKNKIIITTSCGVTSSVLIDLVSKSKCNIPIVFIDTRFLFAETIHYFEKLKKYYPLLKFIKINNDKDREEYYSKNNDKIKIKDIERCCLDNKINILNNFIKVNNIKCWLSAIRKEQSYTRSLYSEVEHKEKLDVYKVSPILNWLDQDIKNYMEKYNLPNHLLANDGYESIGCEPCTQVGTNRDGRWKDSKKNECGLHL